LVVLEEAMRKKSSYSHVWVMLGERGRERERERERERVHMFVRKTKERILAES
jgi:predicted RNase H-like nuclease (RuvC/YqgF family)